MPLPEQGPSRAPGQLDPGDRGSFSSQLLEREVGSKWQSEVRSAPRSLEPDAQGLIKVSTCE